MVSHSLLLNLKLNFSGFLKLSINAKANFYIFECDGMSKWDIQLAPSGQMSTWIREGIRVAEVVQKVWTQTKILSPDIPSIVEIL